MGDGTGLPDWLWVAGQALLAALFFAFFCLVIRLCLHLAKSGCAYNSAQLPDGKDSATGRPIDPERPSTDQGTRT